MTFSLSSSLWIRVLNSVSDLTSRVRRPQISDGGYERVKITLKDPGRVSTFGKKNLGKK